MPARLGLPPYGTMGAGVVHPFDTRGMVSLRDW